MLQGTSNLGILQTSLTPFSPLPPHLSPPPPSSNPSTYVGCMNSASTCLCCVCPQMPLCMYFVVLNQIFSLLIKFDIDFVFECYFLIIIIIITLCLNAPGCNNIFYGEITFIILLMGIMFIDLNDDEVIIGCCYY